MNTWTFMQIEFIPFLALGLILYISANEFREVRNIRRFQSMVALVMCVLVVDGFNWYTVLHPMALPVWVLWLSNCVYFLLSEVIAYLWFLYVYHQVRRGRPTARWLHMSLLPLAAACLVILSSPWTGAVFAIDPLDHTYTRGGLHLFHTAVGFCYLLSSSVLAFRQSRRARLSEEKKECSFLCHIVILPLAGGILQTANYYCVFLWSFTAAAAFLIFVDFQSHWISIDALTSLNNRGNLEQYLYARARERRLRGYLLMMDVDRFKAINDRYGHPEGDRALRLTAQALRTVFGGASGAFLARYGGDEFVVIVDLEDPESAIRQCQAELEWQRHEQRLPYAVTLSIGYADCSGAEPGTVPDLLRAADAMMYERKRERAANAHPAV